MNNVQSRDWDKLTRRHSAFWECADTDRPLVVALYQAYQDTTLVAAAFGEGELLPDHVDPRPILSEYDRMAAAHETIGDDFVAAGEALLGIPWLEAICGCRVRIPDGQSLWAESPEGGLDIGHLQFSQENPWFQSLLRVVGAVVEHAGGRYPVSISHMRGPADVLAALLGSQTFLTALVDEPERMARLGSAVAEIYVQVVRAQAALIPAFRGGYAIRQFGLWSPQQSVWLQDDTSSMISLRRYQQVFLAALAKMSCFPYGVLHLHAPSLHVAETLAAVPNVRAVNVYFDAPTTNWEKAIPILKKLQEKKVPLIITKDVYRGFLFDEYRFFLENLSPCGLSVHLQAGSIEEAQAVMAKVDELKKGWRSK